jgi:hypothetical protein
VAENDEAVFSIYAIFGLVTIGTIWLVSSVKGTAPLPSATGATIMRHKLRLDYFKLPRFSFILFSILGGKYRLFELFQGKSIEYMKIEIRIFLPHLL